MSTDDTSKALEGLKLISDWSKWLITIETGAIAIIGAIVNADSINTPYLAKIFATLSIICFLISVAGAAILLLSLPEIAQTLRSNTNIWMTRDSIIGRVFRMDTQGFATIESFFFGIGMICFSALIIVTIWSPSVP